MAYVSVKASADANSYSSTMKQMALEAKALASQWTATQAQAKAFGSSTDTLKSKAEALSQKITLQKQIVQLTGDQYGKLSTKLTEQKSKHEELKSKVDSAKKAYEESAAATGKDSEQSKKLKEELTALENELKANEASIDKTESALNKQAIAANNAETKLTGMESELKKVNQELKDHKMDVFADGCDKAGQKIEAFGKKMSVVSGGVAAFGVSAAKMASDFDDSMANINTLLDDDKNLKGYENAVMTMSNKTGMDLKTMSDGMYQAISSLGDNGKETEKIFNTMATSAKAGGAEVSDSVSLISAGMKGYNQVNGETAQKISDLAFQTAKLGVTTFPEMAKSMQPLFPLASSLNISYEELFATMATGTGVTGNTAEVSTQFKAVLSNLMKPTTDMQKLMEKYGYSNGQAMIESEGLTGVLKILQDETGGQSDKLATLFSSTEALTLVTALTGSQFDTFKDKLGQMGSATGATETAYNKLNTSGDKVRIAINQLKNDMVVFGQTIMSSAAPMIEKFGDKVKQLSEWFGGLSEDQKETAVQVGVFVAALAPALVVIGKMGQGVKTVWDTYKGFRDIIAKVVEKIALKTAATTADAAADTAGAVAGAANATATSGGTVAVLAHTVATKAAAVAQGALNAVMSMNPIALVVIAIAGLVAGFVALYNHSETFRNAVNKLWSGVKEAFGKIGETVSNVVKGVGDAVKTGFNAVKDTMGTVLGAAKDTVKEKLDNIKAAYDENGGGIKGVVAGAWEGIKGYYTAGFTFVDNLTGGKLTEIKDKIGAKLTEWRTAITEKLAPIGEAFSTAWNAIKDTVTTVFETIKNVITVAFMVIQEIFNTAVQVITLPFQFIWENCKGIVIAAWEAIKTAVQTAIDAVSGVITTVMTAIQTTFTTIWTAIQTVFITVWDAIKTAVETAVNAVKTVITTVWNAIYTNVISPVMTAIQTAVTTAWNAIKTAVTTVMSAIQSTVTTIWNAVKTAVTTAVNAIKTTVTTVWNAIKSTIQTVMNGIQSVISTIWNAIKTTVTNVVNGVKSTVTTVFNAIKSTASSVWNGIKSAVETPINAAKSTVSNAVNAIKSTVSSVFNGVRSTVSSVWNSIKSAIETPINAAKNTVGNAINAIKGFFNFSWSLPHLKMPHPYISGSFSLNPPSVPHFGISWYKTGGIMTNPTAFGMNGNNVMVGGEAGAEAILPLAEFYTKVNSMLDSKLKAIKQSTVVNVENHTYLDSDEISSKTVTKVDGKMVKDTKKRR